MRRLPVLLLTLPLLLACGGGCQKRVASDEWDPFKADPPDAILLLEIEKTREFSYPNAFPFIMSVIDSFETAFPGSNAQVIIGEISDKPPAQSILWQGTVPQLK